MRRVIPTLDQLVVGIGPAIHEDAPEADAGVFVAPPAVMRVAAACLAPKPYAGGLRYNAIPILAGDVAGGTR
jgi:hypothetical protein